MRFILIPSRLKALLFRGVNVKREIRNIILFFKYFIISLFKRNNKIVDKSVYFIGNNYNAFYTLALGLQDRGWKACSMNPYEPNDFIQNYHVYANLADDIEALKVFFDVLFNYRILHVYNRTIQSLYTGTSLVLRFLLRVEILRLNGIFIYFSPSGCLDGSTTQEINEITRGLCDKCIWQNNMQVCNDVYNKNKIKWIVKNCKLFTNEVDWDKALAKSKIGCNIPIVSPIDSRIYDPELIVPEEFRISKKPHELVIFTAFGNESLRSNDTRDIKGKKFMIAAINQLIAEGYPICHFHASNIPAKNMKYYQVQSDIIIDQLNYGSIGSSTREGMMLAKPVICHIASKIRNFNIAMKDCPAIDASEETIYEVLKNLVLLPNEERLLIGKKSREWMLKWCNYDVSAERYEKVYEYIKKGKSLDELNAGVCI